MNTKHYFFFFLFLLHATLSIKSSENKWQKRLERFRSLFTCCRTLQDCGYQDGTTQFTTPYQQIPHAPHFSEEEKEQRRRQQNKATHFLIQNLRPEEQAALERENRLLMGPSDSILGIIKEEN